MATVRFVCSARNDCSGAEEEEEIPRVLLFAHDVFFESEDSPTW